MMSFLNPFGLFALFGVPAVLALHLFRRRFRKRDVAGLFLFAPEGLAAVSGRKRTRLLRTASLWLELAASLFLALFLGGLCFGLSSSSEHWICVLDSSASMQAEEDGESTVSRAVAYLDTFFSGLEADTNVTLIATGTRSRIIAGPRASIPEARGALELWTANRQWHSPGPALHLGTEIAGKKDHLLFLTDTPGMNVPERYLYVALGRSLPNTAFAGARRIRKENRDTIFIDLARYSDGPGKVTVALTREDAEGAVNTLKRETVTLEPETVTSRIFSFPKTGSAVTASLSDDALKLDNTVTLLPEPQKVVYAADLLPEEVSQQLDLENAFAALPDIRKTSAEEADLVFTTTSSGGDGLQLMTEVVVRIPGEERDAWQGPYLVERDNALMEGVFLQGVVWTSGRSALEGHPLVSAGNQVLLAVEHPPSGRRITFNMDPAQSNLARSPAWPVFLYNLTGRIRGELPGAADVNLEVGELIVFRRRKSMGDLSEFYLNDPAGRRRNARGSRLLTWEADGPGIYSLYVKEKVRARYSVFFLDTKESDLRRCAAGTVEAAEESLQDEKEITRGDGRTEGRILAFLLLAVIAGDWFVLRQLHSAKQAQGDGK